MRTTGFRSRVGDRSISVVRNPFAPAAAVFPIQCDATQAQVAAVTRTVNHISATTQAQVAAVTRVVSHTCSATQAQLASVTRSIAHLIVATQAQAALVSRVVGHNSSCTQAQVAVCTIQFNPVQAPPTVGGGGEFVIFRDPFRQNPFTDPFRSGRMMPKTPRGER